MKYNIYKAEDLLQKNQLRYDDEIFVYVSYPDIRSDTYLISNYGRVYSTIFNKLMTITYNEKGYTKVTLQKDSKYSSKTLKVHRLVAWEFCSGYDDTHNEIDHLNAIRHDNYYKNLEWVTHEENLRRRRRIYGEMTESQKFIHELCKHMENNINIFDIYYMYHPDEEKTYKNFHDINFYKKLYLIATNKRNEYISSQYHIDIDIVYPRFDKKIKDEQIISINNMIANNYTNIEIMNEFGFVKKSDNPTLYRFICKCRKRSTTRERVTTEEI